MISQTRDRQRGDDLRNQPVQVGVGWTLDVQIAPTNVVKRFVVVHDGHICVLKQGMDTQPGMLVFTQSLLSQGKH